MTLLLEGLDLRRTRGLEIGPLQNPILRRPGADVLYVDHLGTDALRRKYADDPAVQAEAIVAVDIVWAGGDFRAACGGRRFDYVVASHVIEHVPDLIGWLAQLRSVLHPSGTIRLIVPDRRYCFDYRRQTSSIADLILAWRCGAVIPGPRELLDFQLNIAPLSLQQAWAATERADPPPSRAEFDRAIAVLEHAQTHGAYHDVHCWSFTPYGFARLMRQLAAYRLLGFACTRCTATAPGSLDFFVHLMATDDEQLIASSWEWAVQAHAAEAERPAGPRGWRLASRLRRRLRR